MDVEDEVGADEAECLVRYGLTGRVAWFASHSITPERGDLVVLRTSRGLELGEVLRRAPVARARAGEDSVGVFQILRPAAPDDLEAAREAARLRNDRFDLCRRIAEEEGWPLELVDVEPLLDFSTVLHVLSFEPLDPAPIRARFRVSCDFDVHVETLGDEPIAPPTPGRCGDCDCGGGACSRKTARSRVDAAEPLPSPSGSSCGSGCSACGVAALRRPSPQAAVDHGPRPLSNETARG